MAVWTDANGDQHRNVLHYNVSDAAEMHDQASDGDCELRRGSGLMSEQELPARCR
jgi:hypothetical protein